MWRRKYRSWRPSVIAIALVLIGLSVASCAILRTHIHAHGPQVEYRPFSVTTSSTAAPTGFEPMGSSFVNVEQGWVLGASGCQSCPGLDVTNDGGTSWQSLPVPPVQLSWPSSEPNEVSNLYFVNIDDGFLFGPGFEMTTNGGHTWSRVHIPSVTQVAAADGSVFALSETDSETGGSLWRALIGSSTWLPVVMPESTGQFELEAQGSTLLLLQTGFSGPDPSEGQLGALWISTDAGFEWLPRPVPCTVSDGGAAIVSIALGHPAAWLVDCYDNEQSSQAQNTQHHLYGTSNAGETWVRLADPSHTGAPVLLADNGSEHAFLATESGGPNLLFGTMDSGLTWSQVLQSGAGFSGWADLQFVDASTGFIVGPTHYGASHLYRTEDAGLTWIALQIPSPG
jgi:photosystem II stability/assembly factor-like uncharacterized protein